MHELENFSLRGMAECGAALRQTLHDAKSMEMVADRIVRYLRENLVDADKKPALALVRLYKTHPLGELPPDLQDFARGVFGESTHIDTRTKCLTLLATAGDDGRWNSRADSGGHKAIPLPSAQIVAQLPMVAQLVRQFGIEVSDLLESAPSMMIDADQKTYNVFFVEHANGSAFIPAQKEFVIPYGVRSVLGFGGLLHSGDLFAVIMFSKVPIVRNTAELFKALALNVKMALLPFVGGPVFAGGKT